MENIRKELQNGMKRLGITELRPMQKEIFDLFSSGHDLYIQSETGSGKTAAYLIPILNQLNAGEKKLRALIITPTRELARQVHSVVSVLCSSGLLVQSVCLMGGEDSAAQEALLRNRPGIVTATAGRLLDILQRNVIDTEDLSFIVLDEADLLLELGQKDELTQILEILPKVQTALFSATMREELLHMLKEDPIIRCYDDVSVSKKISVHYVIASDRKKELVRLLKNLPVRSAIVFFRYRSECEETAEMLKKEHILAEALTGQMYQKKRNAVMRRFRNGQIRVLCASDVAARGLDIREVTHVFHYGLPYDETSYIHRAGRSMHEGGEGISILLLTEEEAASEEARSYLSEALPLMETETANDLSEPLEKHIPSAGITVYYIRAGKKDKLRPGDIVGALSEIVPFEEIGTVTIYPDHSFVQILSEKKLPSAYKIKGSVRKIEPARNES